MSQRIIEISIAAGLPNTWKQQAMGALAATAGNPEQPAMKSFTIQREMTSFQFKPGKVMWEEYGHEGLYNKIPVSEIKFNGELPLTTISADSIYAVIAEGGTRTIQRHMCRRGADGMQQTWSLFRCAVKQGVRAAM